MRVKKLKVKKKPRKSSKQSKFWRDYRAQRQREWDSEWYKRIRKRVFERDDYTCAITKKKGGQLNLHHIKRYYDNPGLRFDPRNLITLSREAHEMITGREKEYEQKLWRIAQKRERELKNGKAGNKGDK